MFGVLSVDEEGLIGLARDDGAAVLGCYICGHRIAEIAAGDVEVEVEGYVRGIDVFSICYGQIRHVEAHRRGSGAERYGNAVGDEVSVVAQQLNHCQVIAAGGGVEAADVCYVFRFAAHEVDGVRRRILNQGVALQQTYHEIFIYLSGERVFHFHRHLVLVLVVERGLQGEVLSLEQAIFGEGELYAVGAAFHVGDGGFAKGHQHLVPHLLAEGARAVHHRGDFIIAVGQGRHRNSDVADDFAGVDSLELAGAVDGLGARFHVAHPQTHLHLHCGGAKVAEVARQRQGVVHGVVIRRYLHGVLEDCQTGVADV